MRQRSSTGHCKCCKIKVIVNRLILPVCTAGLVDGSQWANVCWYVAPVVESGAENLTGRRYSGGQGHEVLLPLGAATTVTPAWTEPLGAATTVTPAWTAPLGEKESCQG